MDEKRLLRDIGDGILVLSNSGEIRLLNDSARRLLGLAGDYEGKKYLAVIEDNACEGNDEFHQMLIDAVSDKSVLHRRKLKYTVPSGEIRHLIVKSSAYDSRDGSGVILSFTDISEEEALKNRLRDSALTFIVLLLVLCVWNFAFVIWEKCGRSLSESNMTRILIAVSLCAGLSAVRVMKLPVSQLGLRLRGTGRIIFNDILLTFGGVAVMCAVKLVWMKLAPGYFDPSKPFVRMGKYPVSEYISYIVSVISQEFVSRGIVYEGMRRVIPGKNAETVAVLVSSVLFGALHIHCGIVYMLSATLLLCFFGIIYKKQGTIWGLCIPHYVFGMMLGLMDFVVY